LGERLGVVGESGCGKSVTALALMRLVTRPRGRISKGHIWISQRGGQAVDVTRLSYNSLEMRRIRGRDLAMVFQEPMTSLNPSYTIGFQIMEGILLHQPVSKTTARQMAIEALHEVKMPDPAVIVDHYPHQLSGGMRQRVMLAMAMACNPRLLIADEPTTALDVTVQAQILDLVNQLRERSGMAMLWITHNLGVVGELCDRVLVMYLGQVVENAPVWEIFENPRHPYTIGLLSCSYFGESRDLAGREPIRGGVPGPFEHLEGCAFAPRCPRVFGKCKEPPPLVTNGGIQVRCWLHA